MLHDALFNHLELMQPWLLLIAVWLIKALLPSGQKSQLWQAFTLYCELLANKVNRVENTEKQQQIAGVLAVLISLTPIVLMLVLFGNLVDDLWLWQGALLFFALDLMPANKLSDLLKDNTQKSKEQARALLQQYALRDTSRLSHLGLIKASIELYCQRQVQLLLVPSVIFLAFGGVAVICYRCLVVMQQTWTIKFDQYKHFGRFAFNLLALIAWLPQRLLWLLLIITSAPQYLAMLWRACSVYWWTLNNTLFLKTFSHLLSCKLGGVAIYRGIKRRRQVFNQIADEPTIQHWHKAKTMMQLLWFFVLAIIGLLFLFRVILLQTVY